MEKLRDFWEQSPAAVIIALVFVLALAFGLICLGGWLIMLLWNGCLVSAVTFANPIGLWQAVGLECLAGLIIPWRTSVRK